jgi:CRP/FNR family transcriptional regulator
MQEDLAMLAPAAANPARPHPLAPRLQGAAARGTVSPLAALATVQNISAGQLLFQEGEAATAVFEVTQGIVRLYRMMPDGRRCITGFAFPGAALGLPMGEVYAYSAEAVTGCELRRSPRAAVTKMLESNPEFARRMFAIVSDELSAAQDQMLLLGRKSAAERVASFLLWVARKVGRGGNDARQLDLPMSRTDVADYLGLTMETVSREMTKLRQAGLIALPTPHRVDLLQPDTLLLMADEGEVAALRSGKVQGARWPL